MGYTLQQLLAEAGDTEEYDIAKTIKVGMTPRPCQVSAVNGILADVRFGLFDEPGVGKTLPAQAACLYYLLWSNKCLIIMPPALLKQFKASFEFNFKGVYDHFNIHILNDSPAKRDELFEEWEQHGWPDILCMSYAMFVNRKRAAKGIKKNANPRLFTKLVKPYDVVVCDEAHMLSKPGSWASMGVRKICGDDGDSALLLMTGTPMHNTPEDAYGLIKLLTPGAYRNLKQFKGCHCDYTSDDEGYPVMTGYKDMDFLSQNLYKRARRVLKSDVLELGKPNIIEVDVELYPEHIALYKKLVRERFLEVNGEIIDALQAQSLRQKCLQMATCPSLFSEKKIRNAPLEMLDEMLESTGVRAQEKVVIFTNFRSTTEMLAKHLAKLNPAVVYGGKGNNPKEVEKYLHDDTCRVLVANTQSGGVGIDGMQDVGSTAFFFEPTSVPGRFKQAMDRLHRSGQLNIVNVYIFKALKTIAPKMTKQMLAKEGEILFVLKDKQSIFDEILGL